MHSNNYRYLCSSVLLVLLHLQFGRIAYSQGQINFLTRTPTIDAPVTYLDGTLVGAGFTAQLFGRSPDQPGSSLTALLPTANFLGRAGPGYVSPLGGTTVDVPNTVPDQFYEIVLRAYDGPTWDTSACRGESAPVTILLGGGTRPPELLVGLKGFSVTCVPEPTPLTVMVAGAGLAYTLQRNLQSRKGKRPRQLRPN